ncbi:TPA: hypothetical protein ACSTL5_001462 [Serratia fonticola]
MDKIGLKNQLTTDNISEMDVKEIKRQRDVANKRRKEKKYKDFGFSRLKIYLGRNTYENLAEIYEEQRKSPLNIDGRKDIDSLSQVISFCINHTYEQLFIEEEERGVDNALPASNAKSQELYDLYQAVAFLRSQRFSPTEAKNKLGEEGCRPPNLIPGFDPKNRSPAWTVQQVKDLLKFEILNKDLRDLNG